MKENEIVIIIDTFWKVDSIYIGRIGVLKQAPYENGLGKVFVDLENGSHEIVYISLGGCVPAPSLIKELF
jgi:hypothetical protein